MPHLLHKASSFWRDRSGATAIEYVMIASVISIAIVAGARAIGINLNSLFFTKVSAGLG